MSVIGVRVKELMDSGLGCYTAQDQAYREDMIQRIEDARSVEDLKNILHDLITGTNIQFN